MPCNDSIRIDDEHYFQRLQFYTEYLFEAANQSIASLNFFPACNVWSYQELIAKAFRQLYHHRSVIDYFSSSRHPCPVGFGVLALE